MEDAEPLTIHAAAIDQAAANLNRARRHAVTLERLAVSILTFGIVSAIATAALAPPLVWAAFAWALGAAAVWGVLRGLAIHLHLQVDQTMVEGTEPD